VCITLHKLQRLAYRQAFLRSVSDTPCFTSPSGSECEYSAHCDKEFIASIVGADVFRLTLVTEVALFCFVRCLLIIIFVVLDVGEWLCCILISCVAYWTVRWIEDVVFTAL
jgi:hypothetical protein